jgi:hypothetical protein
MSALSAIEAAVVGEPGLAEPSAPPRQSAQRALRLVRQPETAAPGGASAPGDHKAEPRSSSSRGPVRPLLADAVLTPSAIISPRPHVVQGPAPLQLTRRGKAVVAGLVVAVIAALAVAIAVAVVGAAAAPGLGQPGVGHQGMHEIVVQPGQTLWSIASAARPTADPRLVVQQIMAANGMSTAGIAAGQLLWVP